MNELLIQTLSQLNQKLDYISKELTEIKLVQSEQHSSLKEHMARTLINEERLTLMEDFVKPVKSHILFINTFIKIVIGGSAFLVTLKKLGINLPL